MDFAAEFRKKVHLPKPALDLWVEGELAQCLGIPEDSSERLEIIWGEIVVTPAPFLEHNLMVTDVGDAFAVRRAADRSGFFWRTVQTTDLELWKAQGGYTPDLIIASAATLAQVAGTHSRTLLPEHVTMVVEVTSRSNAESDREPKSARSRLTKWSGYAHEGVPFYLLIDRDPTVETVCLYSDPDEKSGRYATVAEWKFGETIVLPEPFGVEIDTSTWTGWAAPKPAKAKRKAKKSAQAPQE